MATSAELQTAIDRFVGITEPNAFNLVNGANNVTVPINGVQVATFSKAILDFQNSAQSVIDNFESDGSTSIGTFTTDSQSALNGFVVSGQSAIATFNTNGQVAIENLQQASAIIATNNATSIGTIINSTIEHTVIADADRFAVVIAGVARWITANRVASYIIGGLAHEAGIAFVAPTTGNNATGVVGISAFPFSTVAAALVASPKICILQNATWAGATLSQPIEINLRNNCTLTVTGKVALSGHKFSILGNGNVYFNPLTPIEIFPIYSSNAPVVINITGDLSIGAALDVFIGALGGITAYINCRRVLALRSTAVSNGLFLCYNYTFPGIFFGSNIKFHTLGAALFSVGGPGGNPKIHFGANCLIWTDGAAPFGNAGSVGGIYATGLVFNTAALSVTSGVSVTGSATSVSWLRSSEFTAI